MLKGKFLQGKRNRRVDNLIYTLTREVVPYYMLKQRRQELGFEGENLENQKRAEIIKRSKTLTMDDFTVRKVYCELNSCNGSNALSGIYYNGAQPNSHARRSEA